MQPVLRRRRNVRKALKLARLLLALDAAAGDARGVALRRVARASVGAGRA